MQQGRSPVVSTRDDVTRNSGDHVPEILRILANASVARLDWKGAPGAHQHKIGHADDCATCVQTS